MSARRASSESARVAAIRADLAAAAAEARAWSHDSTPKPPPAPVADVGVQFDIFQQVPNANFQTAVYVFAIHPSTGVVHFAFGRKVPPKTRVPYGWTKANRGVNPATAPSSVLQGAAGTDARYHGKWASLGGGADRKANSPLEAAVIELNDEAHITPAFDARAHVYVPWARGSGPRGANRRLVLVSADQPKPTSRFYSFVFKMPDWREFERYFPHVDDRARVRGGQALVTASHGEIDYTASFTVDDIVRLQTNALRGTPAVNFFTSYTLRTLQTLAAPAAAADVRRFGGPNAIVPDVAALQALRVPADTGPRVAEGWRNPPGMRYN
jgi:hypothetical protein